MSKDKQLTFRLRFYVRRAKHGRTGCLCLRITVDGERAELSLHTAVATALWSPVEQRCKGRSDEAAQVNNLVADVGARARHLFFHHLMEGRRLSAAALRDALLARDRRPGLLAFVASLNAEFGRRVGRTRAVSTWLKYRTAERHLQRYVNTVVGRDDVAPGEVDETFVAGFVGYLTDRLAPGTVRLYVAALRRFLGQARRRGWLATDPLAGVELPQVAVRREYLSAEELARIGRVSLRGQGERVRLLFLLSCYTGLAYADLCRLGAGAVERDATGGGWLTKRRVKNKRLSVVRLLPAAVELIDRLTPAAEGAKSWLDVPDNRMCNRHLKRLALLAGIARPLHFHVGRHTFATLMLSAGVPIESVSLMLGHSRITTTQIYAQVTRNKIARDMGRVWDMGGALCQL